MRFGSFTHRPCGSHALDFSLDGDFESLEWACRRIQRVLTDTFKTEGLVVIDLRMEPVPPIGPDDVLGEFWGGYTLKFKVIAQGDFDRLASRPDRRSAQAIVVGPRDSTTFCVDFRRHEYVVGKTTADVEGYTVYVYSPLMIACEKVRAICQQMPEYRRIVMSSHAAPRARDFFDIHQMLTVFGVSFSSHDTWSTLVEMFRVKRVPLYLLGKISESREFHRENFRSVQDTVPTGFPLQKIDRYVESLVEQLRPLQARWEEEPPRG